MMKKILFACFCLSQLILFGQVGINTTNPQGVFNVDGAKDNPTSGVPTISQQLNDFSITPSGNVGIGTVSPTEKIDVNGSIRLRNIPSNGGDVMLTADSNGVVRKQALPTVSAPTIIANFSANGISLNNSNWGNYNYTGTSITIPANSRYIINTLQLVTATNTSPMPSSQSAWMRSSFSESSSTFSFSSDIVGSRLISGSWGPSTNYGLISGTIIINNTSSTSKTYYYWAGSMTNNGYTGEINNFGGLTWQENQMYAIPVN